MLTPDSLHTMEMKQLIEDLQGGNLAARDELVRRAASRVTQIASRMLRQFPRIRQQEETVDVAQAALMRLIDSLKELSPATTRDFFNLAGEHIRRQLLDLVKYYRAERRQIPVSLEKKEESSCDGIQAAAPRDSDLEWSRWEEFHDAVAKLPAIEREVVGLIFYHGWTKPQVAELLQISDRQVRRLWVAACCKLRELVQGWLPTT